MKRLLVLAGVTVATACGGGEVTRGDLYSACVEGAMREFDFKTDLALKLAPGDERESQEKFFKSRRAKQSADAEKFCGCSADSLPDRIASDRLHKVMAFYRARGTLAAQSKLDQLTDAEEMEVSKCQAEVMIERMRSEGLID